MSENKEYIAVIGMGYVGLPLAVEFGKKYKTLGYDIDVDRIRELREGRDRTNEVALNQLHMAEHLRYSVNESDLKECNRYVVTVPTPIDERNKPDLTPVISSTKTIAKYLSSGDIVIYESTVYPGVTEEVCVPILEKESGLKYNVDFFCGYSPERINPGDKVRTLTKIQKVTSGSTPGIADKVDELYNSILEAGTFKASSIKVAEAAKVIENTQRDVNIALINELALIFDTMGVDTKEVIEAAGTKWNFIKLFPGLVGGHCIGVDPYYLTFKATENGYEPDLILAARQINNGMSKFLAQKTLKLLITADKKIKNANLLIMGATFKENCPDIRNTKVFDVIKELEEYGCCVDIYDPWVEKADHSKILRGNLISNPFQSDKKYDAVIVTVGHKIFKEREQRDYQSISSNPPVIVDVKGIVPNPTWRL